jgi:ABC-type Mn2+/Zn2+ transport system permease subunit
MKKFKIAGLVLASSLAVTPAALAFGLGDMNLPHDRFNTGDT